MDHNELLHKLVELSDQRFNHVESRLESIEEKLDSFLHQSATNQADLAWVKGSLKITIVFVLGLASSLFTILFK